MHTQAIEDYLKTLYEIQCEHDRVATTVLAERLGVTPASATGMLKKLADMGLVAYEPYQGAILTEAGRHAALQITRHHRLIELFLTEKLEMPWDQVHQEAHKIEHVLSEEVEDRIDALLGHPTSDPHGAPIPSREGDVPRLIRVSLADLKVGQSAVIAEVSDRDSALLHYVGGLGLYPGVEISLVAAAPFDGPLTVRVGGAEQSLGRAAARYILVADVSAGASERLH